MLLLVRTIFRLAPSLGRGRIGDLIKVRQSPSTPWTTKMLLYFDLPLHRF